MNKTYKFKTEIFADGLLEIESDIKGWNEINDFVVNNELKQFPGNKSSINEVALLHNFIEFFFSRLNCNSYKIVTPIFL